MSEPTTPAAVPAGSAPAPAEPGASASTPAHKPPKHKLATEPHGYLADKLTSYVRAVKKLFKKKSPESKGAAPAGAVAAPGEAASPSAGPLGGVGEQMHHHEAAEQLGTEQSTPEKLKNAVVSTVEHVLDEAAALKAGLTGATAEEMEKFRHEAKEGTLGFAAGAAGKPAEA